MNCKMIDDLLKELIAYRREYGNIPVTLLGMDKSINPLNTSAIYSLTYGENPDHEENFVILSTGDEALHLQNDPEE